MIVTSALARWSSSSNRRRAFEVATRVLPWLAAGTLGAILALRHVNLWLALGIAAAFALGVAFAVTRALRRSWHGPDSLARALDRQHASSDLLATALSIEWRGAEGAVEEVVMVRATELVPKVDPVAVAKLRLRPSIAGTMLTAIAVALLVFAGMRTPSAVAAEPVSALSDAEKDAAKAISDSLDQLEKDESLSAEARQEIAQAREALKAAGDAKSQAAALAALSEAMRHLDAAAPRLKNEDLSKLTNDQLAKQLAKAAADDDRSRMAQLAKEALKRAAKSPTDAQTLGDALKSAAIAKSDPFKDDPAKGKRLSQLGAAADAMKQNDLDAAKDALSSLTAPTPGSRPRTDPRASKLDAARAAIAAMRSAAARAAHDGQRRQRR
ncbi:MAG: hypothetical protein KIT31_30425 [Deltaproteobacteria bacterium]|nr:hypothetical protein [Deltaproteobacteria bacterium]